MTRAEESRIARRLWLAFWTTVLVSGAALFACDDLFGPRDQIIYLWPIVVAPLMYAAALVLVTHGLLFGVARILSILKARMNADRT